MFAFKSHERARALASGMRDRRHRVDRQTAVNGRPRSPLARRGTRAGATRVVLGTEGVGDGPRGGCKKAARARERERAAASRRKPLVRLDLALEGLSPTPGPTCAAIRPANALVRGAFVSKPDAPSRVALTTPAPPSSPSNAATAL